MDLDTFTGDFQSMWFDGSSMVIREDLVDGYRTHLYWRIPYDTLKPELLCSRYAVPHNISHLPANITLSGKTE
jgi:hypothetical protein